MVTAELIGTDMTLTYPIHPGLHQPWNHQPISDPIAAQHTIPLESLAGSDQDLLVSTRLVAADLVNAFGSPEVRQIDERGRVRIRYIREQKRVAEFAEAKALK